MSLPRLALTSGWSAIHLLMAMDSILQVRSARCPVSTAWSVKGVLTIVIVGSFKVVLQYDGHPPL